MSAVSAEMAVAAQVLAQAMPALLAGPLADQRTAWDAAARPAPDGVEVTPGTLGGVPVETVRHPEASGRGVVVHFHGGGYCIGSPRSHREFAARLSAAAGATVVLPAYRLAPEHPFPAAVDDALAAIEAAVAAFGADRVGVSGDSAGGGLAVAALARRGAGGGAVPGALVLWSPWVDLAVDAVAAQPGEVVLSGAWLSSCARHYLAGADPGDPAASPVHARLGGLPPTLVLVGSGERLAAESRRLVDRASAAGVEARLDEVPGAVHLWMVFVADAPETRRTMETAGRFLAGHLEGPGAGPVA